MFSMIERQRVTTLRAGIFPWLGISGVRVEGGRQTREGGRGGLVAKPRRWREWPKAIGTTLLSLSFSAPSSNRCSRFTYLFVPSSAPTPRSSRVPEIPDELQHGGLAVTLKLIPRRIQFNVVSRGPGFRSSTI